MGTVDTVEIRVDRERCVGAGMCALTAPDVFDQDGEDGRVLVLDARPAGGRSAAARQAAGFCPAGVITLLAGDAVLAGDAGDDGTPG
ncbi:ferredoxin [Streptomyces sp. NPDC015131]|uniref:ferredoxin n=1 Tax=Streptomyces sp. NPDC015131 TaxID=3364941 RepID=UPI0036FFB49D